MMARGGAKLCLVPSKAAMTTITRGTELPLWAVAAVDRVRVVSLARKSPGFTAPIVEMSNPHPYVQPGEPLNDFLRSFWQRQVDAAEQETPDYRHPPLPLARIKKVMKSDPDVKVRISQCLSYYLVLLTRRR